MERAEGDPSSDRGPASDSGLAALVLLLGVHQIAADPAQLHHALGKSALADNHDLVRLARKLGARARIAQVELARLADSPLPAIMRAIDGRYAVIGGARDGQFLIQWPGQAPVACAIEDLAPLWSGEVLLITTRVDAGGEGRFDLSWFVPALMRAARRGACRSEEHTSELPYLMRISSDVF